MPKSARSERTAKNSAEESVRSFRVPGQMLCSLRLARGWTQVEAAERAGISERLVRKAEAGESIGLQSIAVLADLYSTAQSPLSIDELVSRPLGMAFPEVDIKAIVRRWHGELWNRGRLEILGELAAANCVLHADDRRLRGLTPRAHQPTASASSA